MSFRSPLGTLPPLADHEATTAALRVLAGEDPTAVGASLGVTADRVLESHRAFVDAGTRAVSPGFWGTVRRRLNLMRGLIFFLAALFGMAVLMVTGGLQEVMPWAIALYVAVGLGQGLVLTLAVAYEHAIGFAPPPERVFIRAVLGGKVVELRAAPFGLPIAGYALRKRGKQGENGLVLFVPLRWCPYWLVCWVRRRMFPDGVLPTEVHDAWAYGPADGRTPWDGPGEEWSELALQHLHEAGSGTWAPFGVLPAADSGTQG